MEELERRIIKDGIVMKGDVLNVGSFLNQNIDVELLFSMGKEISRLFCSEKITKILTVEASGIALAVAAAHYLKVPTVFAKKQKTSNVNGGVYSAEIKSFTHNKVYNVIISDQYLSKNDRVLIVDDFLANGQAVRGLSELIKQAGATLVGCAIAIEKGFSHGGDELRAEGVRLESLAIVEEMENGNIKFRK